MGRKPPQNATQGNATMQQTTRDIMTTIAPMTKAQRKALRRASARQEALAQCVIPYDRERHLKVILIVRRTQWSDWAKLSVLSDINIKLSDNKLSQSEANSLAIGRADAWQRQGMFAEVRVQWRYSKPPVESTWRPAKRQETAGPTAGPRRQPSETRSKVAGILKDFI